MTGSQPASTSEPRAKKRCVSVAKTGVKRQSSSQINRISSWVRLKTSGRSPSPRSGHDVVLIGSKAYLFGGCGGEEDQITCLNDIFVFDLELHRWDKVAVRSDSPLPRASFGMCAGPTPNTLIVAGGTGVDMDSLRADVVEFDARTRMWKKLVTDSEDTPCKFYGQSICSYLDTILLFGGSTGLHYANDLYEYNTRYNSWRKLPTTGRRPSPRYKHQAVVVRDCMYVIGGGCFKPEQSTIDVYCLNLKTLVWHLPEMGGEIPLARVAHSCSYDAEEDTIYMWGGFTGELSRLQDFYAYHCATGVWRRVDPPRPPSPRAAAPSSTAPESAAAGSQSASQIDDDCSAVPPARAFHSALFYNGSLYVFSGANGDVRYSDVWRYRVRGSPPSLGVLAAHALRANGVAAQGVADLCLPFELLQGVLLMNEHADRLC